MQTAAVGVEGTGWNVRGGWRTGVCAEEAPSSAHRRAAESTGENALLAQSHASVWRERTTGEMGAAYLRSNHVAPTRLLYRYGTNVLYSSFHCQRYISTLSRARKELKKKRA
ncbi:unnamed protein product [Ectocarpus fasciculatus]